jgi:hypothetical protein
VRMLENCAQINLELSMPLNSESPASTDILDDGDAERGVRRALGLEGLTPGQDSSANTFRPSAQFTPDRQKRRFVQDGEVPVVLVNGQGGHARHVVDPRLSAGSPSTNRLEAAETALKAEREARERADRSFMEAQTMIRDLQTKLAHANLARDEAREAAQRSETAMAAESEAREMAEQALRQAELARDAAVERVREMKLAARPQKVAVEKAVGAPSSGLARTVSRMTNAAPPARSKKSEPKPVRWWFTPKKSSR